MLVLAGLFSLALLWSKLDITPAQLERYGPLVAPFAGLLLPYLLLRKAGTGLRQIPGRPAPRFGNALAEPVRGDPTAPGPKYNLVVLNDDTHTQDYVVQLLQEVLGVSPEWAVALTREIDQAGRAVVFTGSLEEVTRSRDRMLARGPDADLPQSVGPLGLEVVEAE